MTDIPMKNKNRTSGTVCRGYGFFIVKAIPHKERLATLCGIALICFAFTQQN